MAKIFASFFLSYWHFIILDYLGFLGFLVKRKLPIDSELSHNSFSFPSCFLVLFPVRKNVMKHVVELSDSLIIVLIMSLT